MSTDWPDSDSLREEDVSSISTLSSISDIDTDTQSEGDYSLEPLSERIATAKAAYFRDLNDSTSKQPTINQIARNHDLCYSTLERYLKDPGHISQGEQHASMQLLSPQDERALAERAKFMDDWNCAPDKDVLYHLACQLLESKGVENPKIGRDWIYRFLKRNPDVSYIFNKPLPRDRANAEDYEVMNGHFVKVSLH